MEPSQRLPRKSHVSASSSSNSSNQPALTSYSHSTESHTDSTPTYTPPPLLPTPPPTVFSFSTNGLHPSPFSAMQNSDIAMLEEPPHTATGFALSETFHGKKVKRLHERSNEDRRYGSAMSLQSNPLVLTPAAKIISDMSSEDPTAPSPHHVITSPHLPSPLIGPSPLSRWSTPSMASTPYTIHTPTPYPHPHAAPIHTATPTYLPVYHTTPIPEHPGHVAHTHRRTQKNTRQGLHPVRERRLTFTLLLGVVILNAGIFCLLFARRLWSIQGFLAGFQLEALVLIVFPLMKLVVSWVRTPPPPPDIVVDACPVLVFIPTYKEPVHVMRQTIEAIHSQTYNRERITLFIVVDGDEKGLHSCLQVLGKDLSSGIRNPVTQNIEYTGVLDGMRYVVILKHQHSGKHASEIVMIRFLQRHPNHFKYVVTVDSDTVLKPDALSNILTVMEHSDEAEPIIGACGKITVANESRTLLTRLQAFIYTVNHVVDKTFQHWIGFITCLPGCFCVFRVDRLVDPDFDYWGIHKEDNHRHNYTRTPQTNLDRALLVMGEDRWRSSLLLFRRSSFEKVIYVSYAVAETWVPESTVQYVNQQRRWFLSTAANQMMILRSLRLWCRNPLGVFTESLSLFGSLVQPVVCMLLYCTITLLLWQEATLGLLFALVVFVMVVFTCYIHGRLVHALWMFIFFPLGPIIMIYIPLYAMATATNSSWGSRGDRPRVTDGQMRSQLVVVYILLLVAVIAVLALFFCDTVHTKCYF